MFSAYRPGRTVRARVRVVDGDTDQRRRDELVTEEPLEIRIAGGPGAAPFPLAVTMRTPGNDFELAAGFLFTEGIVQSADQIRELKYCTSPAVDGLQLYNIVSVELRGGAEFDPKRLQRNFYATSSCGVCGKASLDAVEMRCSPVKEGPVISPEVIRALPDALRSGQILFEKTGGIHAAGIFDAGGRALAIREDVGRHNAVDKVIGEAFLNRRLPLADKILMVSGRASFEIMQKAAMAGIPIVVAVSAPSSLAAHAAERFNMTLIGFLRGERFNVYAGEERVQGPGPASNGRAQGQAPKAPAALAARGASGGPARVGGLLGREADVAGQGPKPVPMVSVVGSSGSGKTTLIESVIRELARRGLSVGAVKHSHHALSFDRGGKDSARLLEAGAAASFAAGADVAALTIPASRFDGSDPKRIERLMREAADGLDLIIVEGYKRGPLPKIFVEHPAKPEDLQPEELSNVVAVVAAPGDGGRFWQGAPGASIPRIAADDPGKVAALIASLLETGGFGKGATP